MRLIDLAAKFFEREHHAERIRAEAQERAEAILARAEQDAQAAASDDGARAKQLLDTGESKAAGAARLGLNTAEFKRHLGASPDTAGDAAGGTPKQSAELVAVGL